MALEINCIWHSEWDSNQSSKEDGLLAIRIEGYDAIEIIESLLREKSISKMEILDIVGEKFARNYFGFVEPEEEKENDS